MQHVLFLRLSRVQQLLLLAGASATAGSGFTAVEQFSDPSSSILALQRFHCCQHVPESCLSLDVPSVACVISCRINWNTRKNWVISFSYAALKRRKTSSWHIWTVFQIYISTHWPWLFAQKVWHQWMISNCYIFYYVVSITITVIAVNDVLRVFKESSFWKRSFLL